MSKSTELKNRTEACAIAVVKLCRTLPQTVETRRMVPQLIDAATAVAANYRAACRGRSRAEFIAKLGTVAEEADETALWLGLLFKTEQVTADAAAPLRQEADELTAIFTASIRTARARR